MLAITLLECMKDASYEHLPDNCESVGAGSRTLLVP
jgi:hypothetical protein